MASKLADNINTPQRLRGIYIINDPTWDKVTKLYKI